MFDPIDGVAWTWFLVIAVGGPLLGWALMALDYRAYLRSLRTALVSVKQYALSLPDWVREDRPECLQDLGLTLPCSRDEVLAAYRRRVKDLHPDRGGERRRFELLQRHFEEALVLVEKSSHQA